MKPSPNKAFNAACAKYMGYAVHDELSHLDWVAINVTNHKGKVVFDQYRPREDANQLLPVVDKIMAEKNRNVLIFVEVGAKTALIDFVSEALNIEATNVES